MSAIKRLILVFFCLICIITSATAQILDDSDKQDETSKDEALFDELFSEYSEEERDVTKVKTFGDAMDNIAQSINKKEIEKETQLAKKDLPPLEGNILIGITKNSFSIYQNAFNEPACKFTVTVKSNLNRDINLMAMNLIFTKGAFAFIFRDIEAGESSTHQIRTMGDICYNIAGVPDIDIHKCKIVGASSKECSERMEWSNNLYTEQ